MVTEAVSELVQFRSGVIAAALEARQGTLSGRGASLGVVARRDLTRYYALLERELPRGELTEAEAAALTVALRDLPLDPSLTLILWAPVEAAMDRGQIDQAVGAQLAAKIRGLNLGQRYALADAAERANALVAAGMTVGNAVLRVGLVHR